MTINSIFRNTKSVKAAAILLGISSLLFFQGCNHHQVVKNFQSHKITINRHGVTNRLGIEDRAPVAIFRYDGYNMSGQRLQVSINQDEEVTVNDNAIGRLKQGDEVHISNDGMTVNSLDYGQTEKYLQGNGKQITAQNVGS